LWEADGRPDGMSDHYWKKASEEPDVSAQPKAKATAAKTAAELKAGKAKDKIVNPADTAPAKVKTVAKPKQKAAAAKASAPAVKVKPAAKAPKKAAKKA
jgi:hypothetical protein